MFNMVKIILFMTTFLFSAGFDTGIKKQTFLKPEEAFKVSSVKKDGMIETTIKLGDKIHIYDDALHFRVTKPQSFELKEIEKPVPHDVDGDLVHEGELVIRIPVDTIESKVQGDYTFTVELEGCSDTGICYQPQKKSFDFKGSETAVSAKTIDTKVPDKEKSVQESEESDVFDKISALTEEGNSAKIADVLSRESSFFVIFLFFIFGLLLSLTPCIFPMIPILSSIIVSQSSDGKSSTGQAFFTSLVYVLSMAVTYTIVGLIAGLLGADIQTAMQNPWVLTVFAAMFVALAFSLFGYYEIGLPQSIQGKLTRVSDNAQSKGILGTAIMGLLSALIVGPCVAPPLGGAILFISHTGDALLGGMALFVMSMGMGMPLLLVGVGAGKFMPKPGGWMSKISQVFGITMLGLAIFMLARILPDAITIILWAMLAIGTALYLGLFDGKNPATIGGYLSKLFAIMFLVYGVVLFIGSISGATSVLRPFESFTQGNKVVMNEILETVTKSDRGYSVERLMKEVAASDKPVVVDFGKDSCTACTELEEITFPHPLVQKELKNFTFIKIDLTDNSDDDKAILKKYELFGTPNIIFFDKSNAYLAEKTLTGFIKPEVFAKHLNEISK
ncbi:MAG: protein-disulfide reductase DsbD [Campylobacterota bacterium]|nr:protein-disulfide reductase DsbD [Campylobacterota bacterium]